MMGRCGKFANLLEKIFLLKFGVNKVKKKNLNSFSISQDSIIQLNFFSKIILSKSFWWEDQS